MVAGQGTVKPSLGQAKHRPSLATVRVSMELLSHLLSIIWVREGSKKNPELS